jgi:hypothetical protein
MNKLIIIGIIVVISLAIGIPFEVKRRRRLNRYWSRPCTGRDWKRRFPGVPKNLLKKEDASIAFMFDDFKRNTAFFKLAAWHRHGLVPESDLALFTQETQNIIKALNENAR